ncbi:metallophosphoesterase family protein [Fulvivirgaceae bacterium BMA12]|uniref:Metallophosphoesterase family protein n=1 Tax=Agaribacillus aureus TaxID=3051825 RepID=A0ABT8LGM9_9BACT|nr:metallophosphoesterase family protein [Fulvivirgaceae bacterium BMA12]
MEKQINRSRNFQLSYKISKPDGARRLVISDVHGCIKSLEGLLDKVKIQKTDQLFFLGDYIDRGPSSSGVLDLIANLQQEGYTIFPLRGNHEQMLLDVALNNPGGLVHHALEYNVMDLLEEGRLKADYFNFLDALPYYYELDHFYLVHGGFNFQAANPFEDYDSMLWIRNFIPDNEWLKNKKVVHGHDPALMEVIEDSIATRKLKIPLDNGCVHYGLRVGMGNLLCLNLETFTLTIQENIDH